MPTWDLIHQLAVACCDLFFIMGSSKNSDGKTKYRATVSPSLSSNEYPQPTTTTRDSSRDTTRDTKIPVQQPDKDTGASANLPSSERKAKYQSVYQNPGPGFEQTVANVPGVGLVYNNQPGQSYNGYNPATVQQQPQQHQIPGVAQPQAPQILPPGFSQVPQVPQLPQFPQFPTQPVGNQSHPAMAYNITSMPTQGQHFQPPVPDTTYGPIPHTYHPRSDADNGGNQFVTIGGAVYQVQQVQAGANAGAQVYVPVQQVSALTQGSSTASPVYEVTPGYIAQEVSSSSQQPVIASPHKAIFLIGLFISTSFLSESGS